MKIFPLRIHEYLFLLAGIGIIAVLPWFEQAGIPVWYLTRALYALGVFLFVLKVARDVRN